MMKYQVLLETVCDGWVNCWHDEDSKLSVFASIEEAEAEIADCLELCAQAGMTGYSREDYRIEEVVQ
jgi:predicted RNase H-like HicB family nuclease